MRVSLKQIAKYIRIDYQNSNYRVLERTAQYEFSIDNLTLRCKANNRAVAALCDRYKKGLPRGGRTQGSLLPGPPNNRGRFSITAFKQFLEDQEPDNAVEYAKLYDWQSMSPEIQASVRWAAGLR